MTTTKEDPQPRSGYMWCETCDGYGEYDEGQPDNLNTWNCTDCDGSGIVEDHDYEWPEERGDDEC